MPPTKPPPVPPSPRPYHKTDKIERSEATGKKQLPRSVEVNIDPPGLSDEDLMLAPDEDTDRRPLAALGGSGTNPGRRGRKTGQGYAPAAAQLAASKVPTLQNVPAPEIAPAPSSSRLAVQLGRVLKRKREAIALSLAQAGQLAGIQAGEIASYESGARTPYDHALILARILGIPATELPGVRSGGDSPVAGAVVQARASLAETVKLSYRCDGGEKLDGPVDTLTGLTEFAIEIADDSLVDFPRGSLLGFVKDRTREAQPSPGVVLAHHRRSNIMTLRRIQEHLLVGLHPDLPSYHLDRGQWEILGRLAIVLSPSGA